MAHFASALSPDEAWQPFVPKSDRPFDRRLAAHLYRRAGFAGSPDELAAAVKLGLAGTVEQLLTAQSRAAAFDEEMRKFAQVTLAAGNTELLSGWWLHRMRHTPAPLVEKMIRNISFAGGLDQVEPAIETLKAFAAAGMTEIALRVHDDPADAIRLIGERVIQALR